MAQIHELLSDIGRQQTLQLGIDRRVIDAAAGYLSAEDNETSFLFSGWTYTSFPHRRLADDASWTLRTDQATLVVQPGLRVPASGEAVAVGVPYGSRARLILLYLQTQAIKTSSREVELGKTLTAWLRRMQISIGGKSLTDVRAQADRIARCRMTFEFRSGGILGLRNQHILDQALFADDQAPTGSVPFLETARLSESYFDELRRHPVPVEEIAIRQISNNSMAIDIYTWLAYRLHSLAAPRPISWKALDAQFGHGFARIDNFRRQFKENLDLAMAVYPGAVVEVSSAGVVLKPSRSPTEPKLYRSSRLTSS